MQRQKSYKASITIEMSYVMPIILFVLLVLIRVSFYFHDKLIISGAVGETLVAGTQYAREEGRDHVDLKTFFEERTKNKLLILQTEEIDVSENKKQIQVNVKAKKRKMQLHLSQKADMMRPEEILRKKRKWEKASQKGK